MRLTAGSCRSRNCCCDSAGRRLHVVVQVAVAEVAEVDQTRLPGRPPAARHRCAATNAAMRRHRQRDVVLDVRALRGSAPAGSTRARATARAPAPRSRRAPRRRCGRAPAPPAAALRTLLRACASLARRRCSSSTVHGARAAAAAAAAGSACATSSSAKRPITSKPVSAGAEPRRASSQQRHAGRERRAGRERGQLRRGQRMQLQRRRGDDAQRAFAADEQVAQVVAGVVLAQPAQAVPDLALRR